MLAKEFEVCRSMTTDLRLLTDHASQESQQGAREVKRDRSVSRVRERKLPAGSSLEASGRTEWRADIYRADDGDEIEIIEVD